MNYYQSLRRLLEKIDDIEDIPDLPDPLGSDFDGMDDVVDALGKDPDWKGQETDLSPIGSKGGGEGEGDGENKNDRKGDGKGKDGDDWLDDKEQGSTSSSERKEKEIEDKLGNRGDKTADDIADQDTNKSTPPNTPQGSNQTLKKSDEEIKPTFSWKALISQFVASAAPPETTYTRPAARAATQVSVAQQTGAAAIKPGQRPGEEVYKLAFVFDTSGSMYSAIGPALAEARNLLKMQKASTDATLGICFFASQYLLIEANIMSNIGWKVDSFKNMGRPVPATEKKSLDTILRSSDTGGTEFGSQLTSELQSIAGKGYNIIIFSDTDLLDDYNWNNFLSLWKNNKRKVFFIAPNLNEYRKIIKKLGVKPNNFGHM